MKAHTRPIGTTNNTSYGDEEQYNNKNKGSTKDGCKEEGGCEEKIPKVPSKKEQEELDN